MAQTLLQNRTRCPDQVNSMGNGIHKLAHTKAAGDHNLALPMTNGGTFFQTKGRGVTWNSRNMIKELRDAVSVRNALSILFDCRFIIQKNTRNRNRFSVLPDPDDSRHKNYFEEYIWCTNQSWVIVE